MKRLVVLSLVCLISQAARGAETQEMHKALADRIAQSNLMRVAVLPIPIHREGEQESLGSADLGPMGPWVADVLAEKLSENAGGRFAVVDNRRMIDALRKTQFKLEDLGSSERLQELSQAVNGIDGLVVGRVVDQRYPSEPAGPLAGKVRQSQITFNIVDVKNGDLIGSVSDELPINNTLAVYRGGSSSMRDFQNAGLGSKAPNIVDAAGPQAAPPAGARSPQVIPEAAPAQPVPGQPTPPAAPAAPSIPPPVPAPAPSAPNIPPSVQPVVTTNGHPLRNPNLAIGFDVLVNGQDRKPQFIKNPKTGEEECWVALEPGEKYILRIKKENPRRLYILATVDGLNSLTKTRDLGKCWFLREGARNALIDGWSVKRDSGYVQEEFVVAPGQDSLAYAAGDEAAKQIGQISFMLFPVAGEEKGFKPQGAKAALSGIGASTFGTASGQVIKGAVKEYAGAPDRSTESIGVTIHYAPQAVIASKMGSTQ